MEALASCQESRKPVTQPRGNKYKECYLMMIKLQHQQ